MLIERARRRERKTENIDTPNCSQITNTFIISTGRLERPEKNKIQSNEMIDTEHKKKVSEQQRFFSYMQYNKNVIYKFQ
jgi:hypothetical protein